MLRTMKSAVSRSLPSRMRTWLWRLTDSEYRRKYNGHRRRIGTLRNAQNEVGCEILDRHGAVVLQGPFEGMKYHARLKGTIPTHKILGTYEKELWDAIESACGARYSTVIDIGAAEGFYVVGFARRIADARIVAFEADRSLHSQITRLAKVNGVSDRVDVRGFCDAASLKSVLHGTSRCLVVCDIEGAEREVLDPNVVTDLRNCDILVEVHDELAQGVGAILEKRFASTHHVQRIDGKNRTSRDFPFPGLKSEELQVAAMDECRGSNWYWFWMQAAINASTGGAA